MAKPSSYPDFATDVNYTNGPDVGTPTKVEPSAGERAEGNVAGTAPAAQKANWWQNLVGKWTAWFDLIASGFQSLSSSTWTSRTAAGSFAGSFNGVTSSASLFVAVGSSGTIQTSPDGTAWTARTADGGFASAFQDVTFGNGLFVAVGQTGEIQTSPDGTTWTARTADGSYAGTFEGVTYGGGLYVAVGQSGEIQTSPDGTTWTARTPAGGFASAFFAVGYGGGVFVAVGQSGEIQTSTDGTTWTNRSPAGSYSGNFEGVTFGVDLFVAVGAGDAIQTSPDGTTWTARTAAGTSDDFKGVSYGDGQFVAVAEFAVIQTSTDGITWTNRSAGGGYADDFFSSVFGQGFFVAVGDSGGIQTSMGPGKIREIEERIESRLWHGLIATGSPVTDPLSISEVSADRGFSLTSDEVQVPEPGRYLVTFETQCRSTSTSNPTDLEAAINVAGSAVALHRAVRYSATATDNVSMHFSAIVEISDPDTDLISISLAASGGDANITSSGGGRSNVYIIRQ